jgi:hypothetical protein
LSWTSNDTNTSDQKLFNEATLSLKEIVKRLQIRTIFADKHNSHSFVVDLDILHNSITEQRHRKFGRCYTYHPEKKMRDLGIYYIKAEL